ncbi:MAG: ankyrin repeat domain-containing protein [Rhodocyclaceae bacterium]
MSSQDALIKAVRSGHLVEVLAALEAGAPVEINDGQGVPGLPLGIACFMGFPDIVRELVRRGAKVNIADNNEPVSPLSMAIRGGKTDVVKLLIELGADVPPGMQTGLSEQDLAQAKYLARVYRTMPGGAAAGEEPVIEEIVMPKAFGTDTTVLEADVLRAVREAEEKKKQR